MTNQNHERNMNDLVQALRIGGVKVERCGRSHIVCSFNSYTNYMLGVSSTDLSLSDARDMERDRLVYWAERYKRWENAARADVAQAERRAIEHHAKVESYLKQLNELK